MKVYVPPTESFFATSFFRIFFKIQYFEKSPTSPIKVKKSNSLLSSWCDHHTVEVILKVPNNCNFWSKNRLLSKVALNLFRKSSRIVYQYFRQDRKSGEWKVKSKCVPLCCWETYGSVCTEMHGWECRMSTH